MRRAPILSPICEQSLRRPCVFSPPLPFALPRVVPVGGSTVDGHYLPGGVRNRHCLFALDIPV